MGRTRLKLIKGGVGDDFGDSTDIPGPPDTHDIPDLPDYREFLPQGTTSFGVLDEANEAAFRAQFPELIPQLERLKQEIHRWQEIFKNLPSAAAKDQAGLLNWSLHLSPFIEPSMKEAEQDPEQEYDTQPGQTPFKVTVRCVESPASGFEILKKICDWVQRIPTLLKTIQEEKKDAEGRYQKAAEAINEQLVKWTLEAKDRPNLDLIKLDESVETLRRLFFRLTSEQKKAFLRGGANEFTKKIDALEREGKRAQGAAKMEKELRQIQALLTKKLPAEYNIATWETMFREYLDQPAPTPIKTQSHSFSTAPTLYFTHDPIQVAKQKAKTAHEEAERQAALKAAREAALEAQQAGQSAFALRATRAKTRRRFGRILAPFLALVAVSAAYWAVYEKLKRDEALEREATALEREEDAEVDLNRLSGLSAGLDARIETLIGEAAEESVEEALKNSDALANYAEFGDMTLFYQIVQSAFKEKFGGSQLVRMTEMKMDVIPEGEGVGLPYFYTLEITYSVEETLIGVVHERVLLRPHVPFDRVPANPATDMAD